jgi:DNA repair protein RecO
MPAEKITGMVVGISPFRESSAIITLLARREGLLHGIAKGIKQRKPAGLFIERGFLLELLLYRKPHRDLHVLGNIAVVEFFETIRADLFKSTLRDAAFETISAGVSHEASQTELFDLLHLFCRELSEEKSQARCVLLLWKFYLGFAHHMGFAPDLSCCERCGKPMDLTEDFILLPEAGRCSCLACARRSEGAAQVPSFALSGYGGRQIAPPQGIAKAELRRITGLWADYCRYHCEISYDYKSLSFLYTIL